MSEWCNNPGDPGCPNEAYICKECHERLMESAAAALQARVEEVTEERELWRRAQIRARVRELEGERDRFKADWEQAFRVANENCAEARELESRLSRADATVERLLELLSVHNVALAASEGEGK